MLQSIFVCNMEERKRYDQSTIKEENSMHIDKFNSVASCLLSQCETQDNLSLNLSGCPCILCGEKETQDFIQGFLNRFMFWSKKFNCRSEQSLLVLDHISIRTRNSYVTFRVVIYEKV